MININKQSITIEFSCLRFHWDITRDCHFGGCQGAHDDGQGVIVALEAVMALYAMNRIPKRTIRAVLFVDEECRGSGAEVYTAHRIS